MRRLLTRLVVLGCLLVCGAVALLLWNPGPWFFATHFGLSPAQLQHFNFLSHIFPGNPQFAFVLWWVLAAGVLLAAVSARDSQLAWEQSLDTSSSSADAMAPGRVLSPTATTVLLTIMAAQVWMWISLAQREYAWTFVALWMTGLVEVLYVGRLWNQATGVRPRFPLDRREAVLLGIICGVFTLYCSADLTSWRYSFMGDEFGFWTLAKFIAEGRLENAFGQGVGGYHPMLSTMYVSLFLRALGSNLFAWRFSSVIAAMLALPAFYIFVREMFGRRAALAATLLLAGNHYFITYAHHGLNNVQVVFPTLLGLALWAWGIRHRDHVAIVGSGIAAGLGFYTFYSSRLTIGFIVLSAVLVSAHAPWPVRRRWVGLVLLGFVVTVVPMFAVPGDHLGAMATQSALANARVDPAAGIAARVWAVLSSPAFRSNWEWCWLDPFYSSRPGRFMFGSWTDSWTASFFLLGLVWSLLCWWRHRMLLWPLACYFVSVLSIGVLHQYSSPPDTRMLFLVPLYLTFAALALDVLQQTAVRSGLASPRAASVCMGAVVIGSLMLNQYRHLVVAPQRTAMHDFGLLVKIAQTYPPDRHLYFVIPPPYGEGFATTMGQLYSFADRVEIVSKPTIDAATEHFIRPALVLFPGMFPDQMADTIAAVRSRYPHHRYEVISDGIQMNHISLVEIPAE